LGHAKAFSSETDSILSSESMRITAITGAAATEIGGQTTCKEHGLLKKSNNATKAELDSFSDTRLNLPDEISFASCSEVLGRLNVKLKNYTNCQEHLCGRDALVFLGDFCQMEAHDVVHKKENSLLWEQALNCMVELKGTHRFKGVMKEMTCEWRENGLTEAHRIILNSRVVGGKDLHGNMVQTPDPLSVRHACWTNKKRASVNASVFKQCLKNCHKDCGSGDIPQTAVVIRARPKWSINGRQIDFTCDQRKTLFEGCSEADCKSARGQCCDPLLCLFCGCEVMTNINEDVECGTANGSTAIFKCVHLKTNCVMMPTRMHGHWVNSVDIDDVEFIELQWTNAKRFKGTFKLTPKNGVFNVDFPHELLGKKVRTKTKVSFTYLPVVINFATTGHKLQGKSLKSLLVAEWALKVKNWAYVVVSRVEELEGLHLAEPIPPDDDCKPSQDHLNMMKRMRPRIAATPNQVDDLMMNFDPDGVVADTIAKMKTADDDDNENDECHDN